MGFARQLIHLQTMTLKICYIENLKQFITEIIIISLSIV